MWNRGMSRDRERIRCDDRCRGGDRNRDRAGDGAGYRDGCTGEGRVRYRDGWDIKR